MSAFPTDAEAEVLAAAAEDALFRVGQMEARIIAAEIAPLIRAREAAAWNRGFNRGYDRGRNPDLGFSPNPYMQETDDARD